LWVQVGFVSEKKGSELDSVKPEINNNDNDDNDGDNENSLVSFFKQLWNEILHGEHWIRSLIIMLILSTFF